MTSSKSGASPDAELTLLTVEELLADVPATEWLVDGLIPMHALSLLHAPPKAGKSTLLLGLLAALEAGSPFCGQAVRQAVTLFLTEEPRAAIAEKVRRFGLGGILTVTRPGAHGLDWESIIEKAVEAALLQGAQVLIVDTLCGWAGLVGDEENSSGAVSAAIRPLREAVWGGLTVILIHHSNKRGGRGVQSIRGSSAIVGEVDACIELRGGGTNQRVLKCSGRYEDHLRELRVVLEEHGYSRDEGQRGRDSSAGASKRAASCPPDDRAAQLLHAVREAGEEGLLLSRVRSLLNCQKLAVRPLVDDLLDSGELRQMGEGGPRDPYRLLLPPS